MYCLIYFTPNSCVLFPMLALFLMFFCPSPLLLVSSVTCFRTAPSEDSQWYFFIPLYVDTEIKPVFGKCNSELLETI